MLSIIKNESYAGVRYVGKREKVETPGGPRWRMKRDKTDHIRQEVPAIVSRATWEEAQRLLKQNWANAPRNAKRDYLLRGLIFCGLCGRRYSGYTTNSGKGAYYKCTAHECQAPIVRAELLETLVWQDTEGFVQDPGPVLAELEKQAGMMMDTGLEEEMRQVKKALARIREERQAILYRIRKRLVSDEEGDAQLVATGHEKDMLEARLETIKAQMQDKEWQRTRMEGATALLERLRERAESADTKTKREVMETLVREIKVLPGEPEPNITVTYLFEEPCRIAYNTLTRRTMLPASARFTWEM